MRGVPALAKPMRATGAIIGAGSAGANNRVCEQPGPSFDRSLSPRSTRSRLSRSYPVLAGDSRGGQPVFVLDQLHVYEAIQPPLQLPSRGRKPASGLA